LIYYANSHKIAWVLLHFIVYITAAYYILYSIYEYDITLSDVNSVYKVALII